MMKSLVSRFKAFALLLAVAAYGGAWAVENLENPVTGETETYYNVFTVAGETAAEWNSAGNWTLNVAGKVPFVSGGNYDSALVDGKTATTDTQIDGYALRVGAYNGASITWNGGLNKIQSGGATAWLTADADSSITIGAFDGGHLEGSASAPLKLYSARAGGITWSAGLSKDGGTQSLPFYYYLSGDGSVVYNGDLSVNASQVIKQADVTLSGTSQVASKTLVSFTSSTATFTADAKINLLDSNGDQVGTKTLATVNTTGTTALTSESDVGTCELVQTSTGIDLYWVDGDPASLTPTVYKPSININFTNGAGNGLTTQADIGLAGYEVPGTSWNNYVVGNSTFSTVNAVDSTGAASAMSGVSVTISGTRGSYSCGNLTSSSNPLHGYIDENDGNPAPTVTVTGIPYYKYRVLVYHSTNTANVPFGYDTINGTNYTYVEDALSEGTTAWGNSGPDNSANAIAEGGNVLVTEALSGSTLTVVGHRLGGANNVRGCIAAIQIIEVKADVGENDLEIAVDGETEYTVTAEDAEKTGTVYLTGSGTLTLAGEKKISAATINVGDLVTLVVNADRLDGTTFTGGGTVVYDGVVPPTGKGWTESAWSGTVWIKNKSGITGNDNATTGVQPNSLGNANSKVKFSGVSGWLEAPVTYNPEIVLENAGYDYALQLTNGNSPASDNGNRCTVIKNLSGDGTLGCGGNTYAWPLLQVWDATRFTGSINTSNASGNGQAKTGLVVVFCASDTEFSDTLYALFRGEGTYPHPHTICVASGTTVTQASTATWTAASGFKVDGTLVANGTLASSASPAVSGSGTVVFTGRAPTVSGDAWWKNAAWTGTVQVKDVTNMVGSGSGTILAFNDYGNERSTLELNGCTGWLPTNYQCTVPLKVTGTLTLNNGGSGRENGFSISSLRGDGMIYGYSSADKVVIRVKEWSNFTGLIQLTNKIVVFGNDELPAERADLTAGQIIVSAGAVVTPQQSSGIWWAVGGIKVNGELRAPNLDKFGDGTTITTTDNGVFTLTDSNNTDDKGVNYARITGTGTLRYADVSGKWRALSAVNFPTGMICENNLSEGLILTTQGENIIGSLAGSGQMRSDWGGSGNVGDRTLRIRQAKDTTYSGLFSSSNDRVSGVYVAPGATTAGTLTLSGTQTASNELTVEAGAKVNLTGTWVGATTVAGTFGGTGTLTGNLTFNAGSTFKAYASDENGLSVSGTVAYPAEGSVTVDVSDLTLSSSGTTLITFTSAPSAEDIASKMAPSSGAFLKLDGSTLKAYPLVATYGGENYATFEAAINAALADEGGEANLAQIVVVDGSAELPAGYHISGNTVVKYPVAVVKNGSYLATGYTDTILQAIQAIYGADYTGAYDYIEIVSGSSFVIPYGLLGDGVLKIKNTANATPIPDGLADDCEVDTNEPEGEVYTEYSKGNKPTVYTWTGAAAEHRWGVKGNWSYVNNSSETVTASRAPAAGDSVVFTSSVSDLTIGAATSVSGVNIGAAVTITKDEYTADVTLTATTGGIVLTGAAATLTVTGVTLSPTPTSGNADYVILSSAVAGVTTYYLGEKINDAGYMDGTTAVITDTSNSVTVPSTATAVQIAITGEDATLESSTLNLTEAPVAVYATDSNGAMISPAVNITGAFKITRSGSTYKVELDENATDVRPAVKTDGGATPMAVTDGAPTFTIKTIPGLWYVVYEGSTVGAIAPVGTPCRAEDVTTSVDGTAPASGVKYYRIAVGASKAALMPATPVTPATPAE